MMFVFLLQDSYQGDILVTLCFKSETRILEIKILEACNLRKEGTPGIPSEQACFFFDNT